ncbi:sulfotransferase 1C4-like isoform X3 [Bacillus rossius redtenbacheri]|uniref:sulfotransferase 1C4-like isoform X3 n=1 Tax=Bacillus rossius redtenbacheri TaxID=93214 RepID=UPI002FDE1EF0
MEPLPADDPRPKTSQEFPLEVRDAEADVNEELLRDFSGERTGFVEVGPDKWFMPSRYRREAAHYYNFKVRPDDTWIVAFPRSGTTMMQEILWLLANDLDFEKARRVPQMKRFPFLEFSMFVHDGMIMQFLRENGADPGKLFPLTVFRRPGYEVLGKMRSPRFIKTHLPFSLLPPGLLDSGCKVVYMARNPKDVAVSYFHFIRLIRCMGYKGDFETYWNQFERNKLPWTPYWSHLKEGWDRRHHPNVMFIFYEDMLKDLSAVLERVARFVGRPVSEKQAEALKEYLRIDNFRRNPAVNMDFLKKAGLLASGEEPFIRRGAAGSSRSSLPVELERRADAWVRDNALRTGVELP